MTGSEEIIGLIPAAGRASRMADLPFSKELLPLASASPIPKGTGRVLRVAIDNALETMTAAGVNDTCVVIAPGKWDIPAHTGNGARFGQNIAFVIAEASPNVPASLDAAWSLIKGREVALLFPDIVFEPKRALKEIIDHRRQISADLVLALVPTSNGEKIDIVTVTDSGSVEKVTPKPGRSHSGWTWIAATWGPSFSRFLHIMAPEISVPANREMYVADVLSAAIDAGLNIRALSFQSGQSFDLGTRDELEEFWKSADN